MRKDCAVVQNTLGHFLKWLTFIHQEWRRRRANKLMVAHITRIASLSPHLLHDMGFVDQADPTAPTTQVLRKGPLILSIQRGPYGAEPIITVTRDSDEPIDKT